MAAPAAEEPRSPPLLARLNESEVPRAIQLVMAIVWSRSEFSTTTTTASTTATATIGDLPGVGRSRYIGWILFVGMPSLLIAAAAGVTYAILSDDGGGRELVSRAGGSCYVAIPILFLVYIAVSLAATGHLSLFAPRTPVAAWEAFYKGMPHEGFGFGLIVLTTSITVWTIGVVVPYAWPLPLLLLVAWTWLLGLLVASIVALWICLFRTYGGGRRENNSCGEAVIDGLAYVYCRLLYEYAVRIHPGASAGAGADAGMQRLDAGVAVV